MHEKAKNFVFNNLNLCIIFYFSVFVLVVLELGGYRAWLDCSVFADGNRWPLTCRSSMKTYFCANIGIQLFRGSKFPTQQLFCSGNGRFSEALKHQPVNEPWLFNAQERTNYRKPFLIIVDCRRTHAEQCSTSTNRKQRHKVFEGWLVISTFQIYYPVQLVFLFPALRIHNKHKAEAKQWLSRNPSDFWWVSRGSQLVPDQGISSIKHPDLDPAQNLISIHLPVSLIDAANMLPWRCSVVVYRLPQKIQIVFFLVLFRTGGRVSPTARITKCFCFHSSSLDPNPSLMADSWIQFFLKTDSKEVFGPGTDEH